MQSVPAPRAAREARSSCALAERLAARLPGCPAMMGEDLGDGVESHLHGEGPRALHRGGDVQPCRNDRIDNRPRSEPLFANLALQENRRQDRKANLGAHQLQNGVETGHLDLNLQPHAGFVRCALDEAT